MKKNLNIIKINGLRGLIIAIMVVCCLATGFIAFPGYVAMHIWNFSAPFFNLPQIGLFLRCFALGNCCSGIFYI